MSNYLPLIVRDILVHTGWNENEIITYSALLEKGSMGLTDLSQETSISIPTLQYTLKKLLIKKMIEKTMVNEKPLYTVSDIEQMKRWVKGYAKKYIQFEEIVDKFIHHYDFNPKIFTPKIRFYEGARGVKQSYRQLLKECTDKEIRCFYSGQENREKSVSDFLKFIFDEFVPKRIEKGIKSKNIVVQNVRNTLMKKEQDKTLSEMKLVPKEFLPEVNTEIIMYNDSMHCMSFDENGAFALILQDRDLMLVLKAIFNMIWFTAERIRPYAGIEGIKESYRQMLEDCREKEIKTMFSVENSGETKLIDFFYKEFIPLRIQKSIFLKQMCVESKEGVDYTRTDKDCLRETKLVPKDTFPSFDIDINLYDDCIHCVNINSNDPYAVILKDASIVSLLKAVFQLLWGKLEK